MRNIIAITLGDIAGIGPEIVVKALNNPRIYDECKPLIVGNRKVLEKELAINKINLELNLVKFPQDGKYKYGIIDYIDIDCNEVEAVRYGIIHKVPGKYAYTLIEKATALAITKEVDAIVTAPIHKKSLNMAGVPHIGHHEIFEALCKTANSLITMFQVEDLKVFFLTRHLSLINAAKAVKKDFVYDNLCREISVLKMLLQKNNPTLAVAGLNPHAGDQGMFGKEEITELEPAIKKAKLAGLDVSGPIAADSVFHLALNGQFDAVLSLYHDQGHIATKMVNFEKTVAVTIGLPFIRTSVDHGTAFDIAGKGIASSVSLEEAILVAAEYSKIYEVV